MQCRAGYVIGLNVNKGPFHDFFFDSPCSPEIIATALRNIAAVVPFGRSFTLLSVACEKHHSHDEWNQITKSTPHGIGLKK